MYRPPQARQNAWKPTGQMRRETVVQIRALAKELEDHHPRMGSHQHLKDAANALERQNSEGAVRHLNAAIGNFQPQSLYRHGMVTDAEYHQAKAHMDAVHRHLLLVKDIQDHEAHNENLTAMGQMPGDETGMPNSDIPSARKGANPMQTPAELPTGGVDENVAKPKSVTSWHVTKQIAASNSGDLTTAVELSAETARLAVTPAPRGRPGGPGLYRVKGNEHSPYLQQVVKALIEKRGMPPGRAYGIARASIRKWGAKSKHPEVRAAATGAEAMEIAAQARAHAHANGRADAIELAPAWMSERRGKGGKWTSGQLAAAVKAVSSSIAASDHAGSHRSTQQYLGMAHEALAKGDLAQARGHLINASGAIGRGAYGSEHHGSADDIHARRIDTIGAQVARSRGKVKEPGQRNPIARAWNPLGNDQPGPLPPSRQGGYSNTGQRAVELGWQDELRGAHGEWAKSLGELAGKLDSDHPGKGLGDHVRTAADAVRRGDFDTAGQHLRAAQNTLRSHEFYAGGRGDATYRNAIGNSYTLGKHISHAGAVIDQAADDTARTAKGKKLRNLSGGTAAREINLVGAGGWSHGFKRAGDPGFDPTPHKGGHRSTHASAVKAGDRLMASFEGGRAGFGPHRVLSAEHHGSGKNSKVTLRVMHERTGKVYKQTVKGHSQVEHAPKGDFNRGQGGKLSPAEHVQRLHDLADKAERAAMLRNNDPDRAGVGAPLYNATDDSEGYGSFQRRGGSSSANSLRSAARAIGAGDYDRARAHVAAAGKSARSEFAHGSDSGLGEQIQRHAGTLGSLPSGNRTGRIDTSPKANAAREAAAKAYAARTAPARRSVPKAPRDPFGPPKVAPYTAPPRMKNPGGRNMENLAGPLLTREQRSAFGETSAQAARRTAATRRRNAGLSNWDDASRAVELAVLLPKG